MAKIKVGILYGGCSVEHGVSIDSARNVDTYIDRSLFDVFLVGITKEGVWKYTSVVETEIEKGTTLQLRLNPSKPDFIDETGKEFQIDIAFSMLHGTNGEDGSIQGLLKTMNIPIVGSEVLGSSISMSKLVAKQLMLQAGVPVVNFLHYRFDEADAIRFDTIKSKLGIPFMVKAANLGSSIGISRVDNEADFAKAVEHSFQYDDDILVEKYIVGREIECGVLDGTPPQASLPGEIIIGQRHAFYTFDAKYKDPEAVKIEVRAKLDKAEVDRIRKLSVRVFQLLHCKDFARVDLFISDDGTIYVNEINTIPGFTNSSMFPMMWDNLGLSFCDLITRLIYLSLNRFKKANRIKKNFESTKKV